MIMTRDKIYAAVALAIIVFLSFMVGFARADYNDDTTKETIIELPVDYLEQIEKRKLGDGFAYTFPPSIFNYRGILQRYICITVVSRGSSIVRAWVVTSYEEKIIIYPLFRSHIQFQDFCMNQDWSQTKDDLGCLKMRDTSLPCVRLRNTLP